MNCKNGSLITAIMLCATLLSGCTLYPTATEQFCQSKGYIKATEHTSYYRDSLSPLRFGIECDHKIVYLNLQKLKWCDTWNKWDRCIGHSYEFKETDMTYTKNVSECLPLVGC